MWQHDILSALMARAAIMDAEGETCASYIQALRGARHIHFGDTDGLESEYQKQAKQGCLVFSDDAGDFQKLPFDRCLFSFLMGKTKLAALVYDDNGRRVVVPFIGDGGHWILCSWIAHVSDSKVEVLKYDFRNTVSGQPVHYFLGMLTSGLSAIHCRNIFLQSNEPPEKLNKKRTKNGKPPLFRYYTLRFVPGCIVKKNETNASTVANVGSMPVHLCRGHYVTYTPEKPMFGRLGLFGKFWVPAHARGSAKNGMIIKDYEVLACV